MVPDMIMPGPGSATRARRWRSAAFALLPLTAGAWAYATSFAATFVFDDFLAILQNPHLRTLWPLTTPLTAPPDTTLAGRPVASLSLALNYAFSGFDTWSYHAVNLAIHLAAGLTLFGVVRRTLATSTMRARFVASADWLAVAVALLWTVHPLQTEAVTYLVQRAESLMGLFVLLALYSAIRAASGRHTRLWSVLAVTWYALALGTKESAVVLPLVVVAWDRVFLAPDDSRPGLPQGRWPLYAGLAIASLVLVFTVPGTRNRSVGFWLDGWTPWTYLLTQARVIVHYLRLAAWPAPLVLDPYWEPVRAFQQAAWQMVLLATLAVLSFAGLLKRHPAAFAGASFFLLLAPTSSVLPVVTEVAAEHRMYLPLAAILALAIIGTHAAAQWLATRAGCNARRRRHASFAAALLLAAIAAAFGATTRARNLDYTSAETIWRDTVAKQPQNPRARTALGAELLAAGRYEEAETELRASLALDGDRAETLSNLGAAEFALGRTDASISHLERALALRPEFAAAHRNLGAAYRTRGRDAEAAAQLRLVLDAEPDHVVVLKDLALLLAITPDDRLRDGTAALAFAGRAVSLTDRQDPASLAALAAAYAELDRFDDAVHTMREAVDRSSGNPALTQQLTGLLQAYTWRQKVRQRR